MQNLFQMRGIPHGFCEIWRELKLLSRENDTPNKLGKLTGLTRNQTKILDGLYINSVDSNKYIANSLTNDQLNKLLNGKVP